MSPLQRDRERYAEQMMLGIEVDTRRLREAFAGTPREDFVGPPPWPLLGHAIGRLWTDDVRELYQDVLVGLDVERGINNGQPSLHARGLAACDPRPGDTVLHVGAGTGYYTAILARLVETDGTVIAYEIESDLAARAAVNLKPWPQASVRAVSGAAPPLPACDVVYVSAGATHPLAAWLDALRDGGRLVFPLTPDDGTGCMLLVTRLRGERYAARSLMRVSFIACVGARDAAASAALRRAFALGPVEAVRSLHRDARPDDSAWCAGPDWWLSTRPPDAAA
ncbi:MAG TPA: protein-L-isoaspartate(D-aspartate) O-methyltransferase [Burkholderiaceae bacterium]|nr:protein-L-isoaspartate(D-aspartate) O-methyltransferase [Burkholderiaceae bacterium]